MLALGILFESGLLRLLYINIMLRLHNKIVKVRVVDTIDLTLSDVLWDRNFEDNRLFIYK